MTYFSTLFGQKQSPRKKSLWTRYEILKKTFFNKNRVKFQLIAIKQRMLTLKRFSAQVIRTKNS